MTKIISLLIITALAAALILSSCGSRPEDRSAETDPAATETEAPVETEAATDTEKEAETSGETEQPETADDNYVNPLEGAETVSEEFEMTEENGMSMEEYKFLKRAFFSKGDKDYNWFEFYNACVSGELRLTDVEVADYIKDCSELFAENDFESEAAQAEILLEALKGLN